MLRGLKGRQRLKAAASKNRSAIFVEPGWFVHTLPNKKGLKLNVTPRKFGTPNSPDDGAL
jgi:hypothetical protein